MLGRTGALALGAAFLAGGALLLGELLGWFDLDWRPVGALVLLALGAVFFLRAATGRGWAWDARAQEGWDPACAPHGQAMGRYWMGVMAVFFVLLALGLLARDLGWGFTWRFAGPYFLLAVGGMFVLRAFLGRPAREGPPVP